MIGRTSVWLMAATAGCLLRALPPSCVAQAVPCESCDFGPIVPPLALHNSRNCMLTFLPLSLVSKAHKPGLYYSVILDK